MYICIFVYLYICIFVYLYICIFVYPSEKVVKGVALDTRLLSASTLGLMPHTAPFAFNARRAAALNKRPSSESHIVSPKLTSGEITFATAQHRLTFSRENNLQYIHHGDPFGEIEVT